jgi:hypothetical protein
VITRFKLRRGTTAQWAAKNPVLLEGEEGLDLDYDRTKIGDGVTPWLSLPWSAAKVTVSVNSADAFPANPQVGDVFIKPIV